MEIQWSLVFFTLLTGLGVGVFSSVAVAEWLGLAESIRLAGAITALLSLIVAGLSSLIHPSHPSRMHHILKHLGTGIGKEMLLAHIAGVLIVIYILILLLEAPASFAKAVAALGLASCIGFAFVTGSAYVLPARPAWNTWFWPFVHVSSAAVVGIFALYVWGGIFRNGIGTNVVMNLNLAALVALIVHAAAVAAYLVFLNESPYKNAGRSPSRLLTGNLARSFWAGLILAGLVIPLGLTIYLQLAKAAQLALPFAALGLAGTLAGGTTIRAIMFTLGSEADPVW